MNVKSLDDSEIEESNPESPENKRKIEDFFKEKAAAWENLLGKACFLEFRMKCILQEYGLLKQLEEQKKEKNKKVYYCDLVEALEEKFEKTGEKLRESKDYRNFLVHSEYEKIISKLGQKKFGNKNDGYTLKFKNGGHFEDYKLHDQFLFIRNNYMEKLNKIFCDAVSELNNLEKKVKND